VRLWDVASGKTVRSFEGPAGEVTFASFLPGGERVVAWGKDRAVRIWEVPSGQALHQFGLGGEIGEPPNAALSPDGRRLITCSDGKTVQALDLATGRFLAVERYEGGIGPQGFSISPDGRYAAASTFRAGVHLWRLPE
jgi:WD40 repeat protein